MNILSILEIDINKAINITTWELANSPKDTYAWFIIQGRLNGYNHILKMIDRLKNEHKL